MLWYVQARMPTGLACSRVARTPVFLAPLCLAAPCKEPESSVWSTETNAKPGTSPTVHVNRNGRIQHLKKSPPHLPLLIDRILLVSHLSSLSASGTRTFTTPTFRCLISSSPFGQIGQRLVDGLSVNVDGELQVIQGRRTLTDVVVLHHDVAGMRPGHRTAAERTTQSIKPRTHEREEMR